MNRRLSHYDLLESLGSGATAQVFLAKDRRLGRHVALKVLRSELVEDQTARQRFIREARVAARLDHPNITAIHEFDETGERCFICMSYAAGEALKARLARSTPTLADVLEVTTQVLDGLAYAHRRGVVHRDIKPGNIYICENGSVRILDFGLAWLEDTTRITRTGSAVGTPAYIAPEQLQGQHGDNRSDLYSLGVVMFEMLCGERPFKGENLSSLLYAVMNHDPNPQLLADKDIPSEVSSLVHRAIQRAPADRFQSAAEMRDSIAELSQRSRASASVASDFQGFPKTLAVLPFVNSGISDEDEYLSDGITDELIILLGKVDGLGVVSRTSAFQFKNTAKDVRAISRELAVDALLEGTVRRSGKALRVTAQLVGGKDGYQLWSDRFDRQVIDVFAIQDEIASAIAAALRLRFSENDKTSSSGEGTPNVEAFEFFLRGRYFWNQRTEEGLRKAVGCLRQAIAVDSFYARAHAALADAYVLLANPGYEGGAARETRLKAKKAAEHALRLEPRLAEAHCSLAQVALGEWDWQEAERRYLSAIDLDPRYATAHHWYGTFLAFLGRFDEAIAETRRAHRLDPLSIPIRTALGWAYLYAQRFSEAIVEFETCLEMDGKFYTALHGVGVARVLSGRPKDGIEALKEAVELSDQAPGSLSKLGYAYAQIGDVSRATDLLGKVREHQRNQRCSPYDVAIIELALGHREAALELLGELIDARDGIAAALRGDVILAPLRDDQRFLELLRRVGLDDKTKSATTG